jgi:hypothetical protein
VEPLDHSALRVDHSRDDARSPLFRSRTGRRAVMHSTAGRWASPNSERALRDRGTPSLIATDLLSVRRKRLRSPAVGARRIETFQLHNREHRELPFQCGTIIPRTILGQSGAKIPEVLQAIATPRVPNGKSIRICVRTVQIVLIALFSMNYTRTMTNTDRPVPDRLRPCRTVVFAIISDIVYAHGESRRGLHEDRRPNCTL